MFAIRRKFNYIFFIFIIENVRIFVKIKKKAFYHILNISSFIYDKMPFFWFLASVLYEFRFRKYLLYLIMCAGQLRMK